MSQPNQTKIALTLLFLALVNCATTTRPRTIANAAAELNTLGQKWWELQLNQWPQQATYLGDHRFDDRLPDPSPAAQKRHLDEVRLLLMQTRRIDPRSLTQEERITHRVLSWVLQRSLDLEVCRHRWWNVDHLYGPQIWLVQLPRYHRLKDRSDVAQLIRRYKAIPKYLEEVTANLRRGLEKGWSSPRITVDRVVKQLGQLLESSANASPFVSSLKPLPSQWTEEQKSKARQSIVEVVAKSVLPAFSKMRTFLRQNYRKRARQTFGVSSLPQGNACYRQSIAYQTGSKASPEKIHQLGLGKVQTFRDEMLDIAKRIAGDQITLAEFSASLLKRKDQRAATGKDFVASADSLLKRTLAALPRAFSTRPKTPIVVKAMPPLQATAAPAAYYYAAPNDGSRPAVYYLNTHKLDSRPLYNLAALTFHEAVPGHHLQMALAAEQKELPIFRRHLRNTAFEEGWALYAETLADDLGLKLDPLSRFGVLNYQLWRAARLVVDTGLHAKNWSRKRAVDYLAGQSTLSQHEAESEVDRYIIWPAQALGYMLGKLTIVRLRQEAEKALGNLFSLKDFHQQILMHGALPLDIMERLVREWTHEKLAKR